MRKVLLVAEREIVDKRAILVAALGAGLLALLTPLLPWSGGSAADTRNAMALILAATFAVAVALMYGASCIARDLRERRLSFYFSRPLPAASLWAGKMLAGVLLVFGSAALVVAPAAVVGGSDVTSWLAEPPGLWLLAVVLALPFFAHAVAVMLASRSAWLAFDLVAFVAVGAATAALLRRIWLTGSTLVFGWTLAATAASLLAALIAAGVVQIVSGRTDVRRGHRALSLTLWGVLAAASVALAGYTAFLLHPTPGSLLSADDIDVARHGTVIAVTGQSRWRGDCMPTFAIDTSSGRCVRLAVGSEDPWQRVIGLAADGSRVAWFEPEGSRQRPSFLVMTSDLTRSDSRPQATTISFPTASFRGAAISDDGRLIALHLESLLSVYELDSGRLRASARLPGRAFTRVTFASADRLWVEQSLDTVGGVGSILTISALDLATGRLEETGRVTAPNATTVVYRLDAAMRAMLTHERIGEENVLVLRDAWTGERIADLARRPASGVGTSYPWMWAAAPLGDGRVALAETGGGEAQLRLFSGTGQPVGTIALGAWTRVRLGAEVAPGRLVVALSSPTSSGSGFFYDDCVILDLATGKRTFVGHDLWPVSPVPWSRDRRFPEPGSLVARLFLARGNLVIWQPEEGGHLQTVLHGLIRF
jgi:hypothetical protein